jgi:uncharacterized protein YutD
MRKLIKEEIKLLREHANKKVWDYFFRQVFDSYFDIVVDYGNQDTTRIEKKLKPTSIIVSNDTPNLSIYVNFRYTQKEVGLSGNYSVFYLNIEPFTNYGLVQLMENLGMVCDGFLISMDIDNVIREIKNVGCDYFIITRHGDTFGNLNIYGNA